MDNNSNNNKKNMTINFSCPDGMVIDMDNTDLSKGTITFKPIENNHEGYDNYRDVALKLFMGDKMHYTINDEGDIHSCLNPLNIIEATKNPLKCVTKEQAEHLLAYNRLLNVAHYLNGDWEPTWNNYRDNCKFYLYYDWDEGTISFDNNRYCQKGGAYFKSRELAEQAISILGEEEIKKALGYYIWKK